MPAPPPFHETQFPVTLSWNAKGGPGFNTTITEIASGWEGRNPNWVSQRHAYDISHLIKDVPAVQQLLNFFYCRRGRAYGFRFKDWGDYEATNESILQIPSGAWQLSKFYADPQNPYTRYIVKPCSGLAPDASGRIAPAPQVFLNAVIQPSAVIDFTTGIVTGVTPGAGDIFTWTGEFDVPVRFDVDASQFNLKGYNNASWEGVKLVEIRPWPTPITPATAQMGHITNVFTYAQGVPVVWYVRVTVQETLIYNGGQAVTFAGLTNATWLNGQTLNIRGTGQGSGNVLDFQQTLFQNVYSTNDTGTVSL